MFLCLFHLWEYIYVALFHPNQLGSHSFLLNHSREYHSALLLGLLEYLIERFFFPQMKQNTLLLFIGFFLALGGQWVRSQSMYTAGSHFHHSIRFQRESGHKLVTSGIYHYLRHPSYFGWFWWAVGTQILLSNPISTIAYAFAAWMFFYNRIRVEERTLIKFFGSEYENYRKRTFVGIPFI